MNVGGVIDHSKKWFFIAERSEEGMIKRESLYTSLLESGYEADVRKCKNKEVILEDGSTYQVPVEEGVDIALAMTVIIAAMDPNI